MCVYVCGCTGVCTPRGQGNQGGVHVTTRGTCDPPSPAGSALATTHHAGMLAAQVRHHAANLGAGSGHFGRPTVVNSYVCRHVASRRQPTTRLRQRWALPLPGRLSCADFDVANEATCSSWAVGASAHGLRSGRHLYVGHTTWIRARSSQAAVQALSSSHRVAAQPVRPQPTTRRSQAVGL